MQEMEVRSLGQEDPLEEEMATHSSILARKKISWTEGYSPWGHEELETTEQPSTHGQHDPISTFIIFSVAHLFQDTHGKKESPEASPARAWQTGVGAPAPGCPAVWAHLRGSGTSWFIYQFLRISFIYLSICPSICLSIHAHAFSDSNLIHVCCGKSKYPRIIVM